MARSNRAKKRMSTEKLATIEEEPAPKGTAAMTAEQVMGMVHCKSLDEVSRRVSRKWPIVIVMTIKGNLRHRIAKLGSEKPPEELTDVQRTLRNIAMQQECKNIISNHHERPSWGGGAFYYCEKEHLELFREVMHRLPFTCQSKHVVCSEGFVECVRACIAAKETVPGRGREAFLIKRAGKIRQFDLIELPVCPMLDVDHLYNREFDSDLILHITSGPSVQASYPEEWGNVWEQVYENESFMLTPVKPSHKNVFTCKACGGRALMNVQHALFGPCSTKIKKNMREGSLFKAIYGLAEEFPPRVFRVDDLSKIEAEAEEADKEIQDPTSDEESCKESHDKGM